MSFTFSLLIQLGPEKGVIHLALAAVVNALWDLWAKMEGKVCPIASLLHSLFNNCRGNKT